MLEALGLFLDFSASLNNVHKLVYTYLIIKSLECIGRLANTYTTEVHPLE